MLFEDIVGVKDGRVVVKDSKTRDKKTSHNYKGYVLEWDNENSNVRAVIKSPKGKIIYEYAKGAEPTFVGFQSKVDANISKTTDSLYKGQKVTAIKSEKGLRAGETYTVIRGEKPIAQSSEADIGTVYVLQDSTGNLVTVSGCEGLFYKTEDAKSDYDKAQLAKGNYYKIILPPGYGEPLYTSNFYAAKEMAKEYGKGTQVVNLKSEGKDSADTFTKGEALKVKIGEIQKNMDAARKMGYDTVQYQKEIDKLQEDSKTKDVQGFGTRIETYKEFTIYKSVGERHTNFIAVDKNQNEAIWADTIQELKRLIDKEIKEGTNDIYTGDPLTEKGKEIMKAMKEQYGEEKGEQVFYASKNKGSISGVDSKTKDEGVSLQTYRGKTFGITKKDGMFEAIFLFEENHIKAPSEQEVINKAKAKIDQFFKNRIGDKTKDVSEYRQGQIKGLKGWYSDYKKAKAYGNDNLAAEIMTNIEKELSITGIKKSEIVEDREIDVKDMKELEIGKDYGFVFGLGKEKAQAIIYNGGNSWTMREGDREQTIESAATTKKAVEYINRSTIIMGR